MKEETHKYWSKATPIPEGMTLIINKPASFHQAECSEILGHLPPLQNQKILELACGIGRFTGLLAKEASKVTVVDFASQLVEKNREDHKDFSNIEYITANVLDLEFAEGQFDMIFINWLFMYLTDDETAAMMQRISNWLKPGGTFFFRESIHTIGRYVYGKYTSIYRKKEEYTRLASPLFKIVRHDIVLTYFLQCKLTNQYFWLCQKD